MTENFPSKTGLQALCEQLISCPHLSVKSRGDGFVVYDDRFYGDILEIRRESHSIINCFCWYTYKVELRYVSIAVSNPRNLFKLAMLRHSELKEKQRLNELKNAIESAVSHLNDEYRKEQNNG